MVCIYCQSPTQVTNSRPQKRLNHIWRRRQCRVCGAIFTTTELPELSTSWRLEHGNRLEPFSRDVLFVSIYDSLKHRKTALSDATALTDTVISHCTKHISNGRLGRQTLVAETTTVLKRFDTAAATYYAAFHTV